MNKEVWRAIKFLLFSISAGAIQMGSFALMNEFTHFKPWLSYLIALTLSVLWNFTLNRRFTFKSTANVPVAMFKVICYYAVFTPLSTMLEKYLTETLMWNEYLVTFINMFINLVTEFLFQRYVVYGGKVDNRVTAKAAVAASEEIVEQ
jgi:putative flippase GtrA